MKRTAFCSAKTWSLYRRDEHGGPRDIPSSVPRRTERGISVLDVAISGSTPVAESGSLTLFGGGDREVFDLVAPIFPAIARQWFYMGPSGSGVAMKLVVNTLLGVGMQAIAEALALGGRMGLPRDLLFETLGKTAVVAPAHLGKLATAKRNDYTAQFPLRLMQKDFGLILSKGRRARRPNARNGGSRRKQYGGSGSRL